MISLRKSIENHAEEVIQSALKSYGDVFVAVGQAGAQACPPAGEDLKESLLNLKQRLDAETSASMFTETEQLLEIELQAWSGRAAHYYQQKTDEVKEILAIVAKAAGEVGERDQRYTKQFGNLTERLDGDFRDAVTRLERIEKWVDGEYLVTTGSGQRKVQVSAASGVASWQVGDSPTTILQRADAAMYEHKALIKAGNKRTSKGH